VDHRGLMTELAGHLEAIADTLRRYAEPDEAGGADRPGTATRGGRLWDPEDAVVHARAVHPLLGSHQEMALRKLAQAFPDGLAASAINDNENTLPNTYTTLEKLAELGLVRQQEGRPRRYFLGPAYQ
jgi:hypothetical protein